MSNYYGDYVWKKGIPYGINAGSIEVPLSYKIAMDPYRKRIAIEKYTNGHFDSLVYDSALLDFRHLTPTAQMAWQKIVLSENEKEGSALIRNQDDRLVLLESYYFSGAYCRQCVAMAPHGLCISRQNIYYTALGDSFNGVILYDGNEHPVMFKCYQDDEETGEFTTLLQEQWNMTEPLPEGYGHYHL